MTTDKLIQELKKKLKEEKEVEEKCKLQTELIVLQKKEIETNADRIMELDPRPKQPRVRVVVFQGLYHQEVKAKIVDGHFLVFKTSDKVTHKVLITTPPAIIKTRRHIFGKFQNVWYCGYFDEITKDPDILKYDITELEEIIGLTKSITDTNLAQKLAEAIKGSKMLREYIPWFLFFFSIPMWLMFIYMLLDSGAYFMK